MKKFNEESMRGFKDIKDAVKSFGEEKIPKKRVVSLFQEAHEIRFANVSVNALYIKNLTKSEAVKYIDRLVGKNKSKLKAYEKAHVLWKNKFNSRNDS
jgi:hypothetical protein